MAVIHFSKEGFDKAVAQGSPMLVDFWASWCGPCKMLAPTVDKLAEKYDGKVIVGKVDVDEEQELARQFGVMSIHRGALQGRQGGRTAGRGHCQVRAGGEIESVAVRNEKRRNIR